jgi:hypothetical protein
MFFRFFEGIPNLYIYIYVHIHVQAWISGNSLEQAVYSKALLKTFKKQKNKGACNPDSGPAVVLGAPRSGSLADFQPEGASKSLPGLQGKKRQKKHIHRNTYMHLHIYAHSIGEFKVPFFEGIHEITT